MMGETLSLGFWDPLDICPVEAQVVMNANDQIQLPLGFHLLIPSNPSPRLLLMP